MDWLTNISFGTPWILSALIVLPAIWFLLRVTPPLPKRVAFPPLRLLLGLRDEEQTPAGTPWWLMLLRLAAAAALIVALAAPSVFMVAVHSFMFDQLPVLLITLMLVRPVKV